MDEAVAPCEVQDRVGASELVVDVSISAKNLGVDAAGPLVDTVEAEVDDTDVKAALQQGVNNVAADVAAGSGNEDSLHHGSQSIKAGALRSSAPTCVPRRTHLLRPRRGGERLEAGGSAVAQGARQGDKSLEDSSGDRSAQARARGAGDGTGDSAHDDAPGGVLGGNDDAVARVDA